MGDLEFVAALGTESMGYLRCDHKQESVNETFDYGAHDS